MEKIVRCAAVFSEHCVLQRNKEIRVWGIADDDVKIRVCLNGQSAETVAVCNKWEVTLPAMEAGGPYTMTILGDGEVFQEFKDVMIGEVWIAGGQSNMEFELRQEADGKAAMERAKTANVRFYYVQKKAFLDEHFYEKERTNHWMCGDDKDVEIWSAVGFYFAEQLSEKLDCCVGIIGCNWGGTSASAWQDKESILSHEDTAIYWEEYEKLLAEQDPAEYEKELQEYKIWHADWQPRMDAYYAEHPNALWDEALAVVGECKWPGPMGPKHEFRPAGLYETMLSRVVPYTLAGAIYYQGESDDHRPDSYYHLLKSLIATWRRDFRDEKLPFIYVQLPAHHYISNETNDHWCIIREAQMRLHKELEATGLAVAMDLGEYNNIHPVHKTQVGVRLALQALHHVYDKCEKSQVYGPIYESHRTIGNKIYISLENSENGLVKKEVEISGFEVAGADDVFFPAEVEIQGNQLIVSSDNVPSPVKVRYLWVDYGLCSIYGTNGLPLAPFRA